MGPVIKLERNREKKMEQNDKKCTIIIFYTGREYNLKQ